MLKFVFSRSMVMGALTASAIAAGGVSPSNAFPIAATGAGLDVVVSSLGDIIATYEGNSAAYTNLLYLDNTNTFIFNNQATPVGTTVNLGSFAAGTILHFRLYVTNTGYDYFTGAASGNPDGNAHARVEAYLTNSTLVSFEDLFNGPFDYNDLSFSFTNTIAVDPVGETPIPGALPLFASGLGALGLITYRRKRKQNR